MNVMCTASFQAKPRSEDDPAHIMTFSLLHVVQSQAWRAGHRGNTWCVTGEPCHW